MFEELFNEESEQILLSYSPGGLAEVSLVALAMDTDVAYIATHHMIRIAFVILLTPLAFSLLRGRANRPDKI